MKILERLLDVFVRFFIALAWLIVLIATLPIFLLAAILDAFFGRQH